MKFSIITASFNQLPWLKRCVRSVADQTGGMEVEHIIQDAGTGAELEDWLRVHSTARVFTEKDRGMYDALNRGLRRAGGDVIGILNCDEQYLPGAFSLVEQAFRAHPGADIVAGDYLLLNAAGGLLSFRRATKLRASMILSDHLYDFTCAMFYSRSFIDRGFLFDPEFRVTGDAEWVSRLLSNGGRAICVRGYLAAFAMTGSNMSLSAKGREEAARLRKTAPRWASYAAPLLRQARHVEKLLAGGYHSGPIAYEVYADESDQSRTRYICEKPAFRHPWNDSIL
jgi:glycosyltransferase involved in cell wall biosynthesis